MDLDTFIVAVFCTMDEELRDLAKHERWRVRGPRLQLADSEVRKARRGGPPRRSGGGSGA